MTRPALVIWSLLAFVLVACAKSSGPNEGSKTGFQPGHRYGVYYVPNDSMLPTIRPHGDELAVDENAYDSADPKRGDIIVFMPPVPAGAPFIKRVVALPGDALEIRNAIIKVNGHVVHPASPLMRPKYNVSVASFRIAVDGVAFVSPIFDVPPRSDWTAPDRLPRGCYFVIGDNASESEDSHVWGCTELRGKFVAGPRSGEPTRLVGKVVKIVSLGSGIR